MPLIKTNSLSFEDIVAILEWQNKRNDLLGLLADSTSTYFMVVDFIEKLNTIELCLYVLLLLAMSVQSVHKVFLCKVSLTISSSSRITERRWFRWSYINHVRWTFLSCWVGKTIILGIPISKALKVHYCRLENLPISSFLYENNILKISH